MLPARATSHIAGVYPPISIALGGLTNAGKTSILKRLITGTFNDFDSGMTLGINVEILYRKFKGQEKKFRFFDMGGHISFRILWSRYLSISQALVYVVDIADRSNLSLALDVFRNFLQHLQTGTKILFIGNKQDLIPDQHLETIIRLFKLGNLDSEYRREIAFFPMSVKTGYNFEKTFNWLMDSFQ